ncbi:uncharacterized protein ARMOST_19074 [Armillaria ostoyae]|uniref:Uncharacterized protein n=1 Tax=Armillaria ostoyae TaxID=47428 RepID=A0A284S3I0_ARMOS|nr:uncharacterized protein ARMOST_19074 [Armillaria ostoyae]
MQLEIALIEINEWDGRDAESSQGRPSCIHVQLEDQAFDARRSEYEALEVDETLRRGSDGGCYLFSRCIVMFR